MSKYSKFRLIRKQDLYVRPLLPAIVVFLAFMTVIGLSWRASKHDIKSQRENSVNENANFIENTIVQRFSIYEGALRAANGFFLGSDNVTRSEWSGFIKSLKLSDRYPGITSVGYIKVVSDAEKQQFVDNVRLNDLPTYDIHPVRQAESYAPLLYIVLTINRTFDERNAPIIGYDMYASPERREAMDAAAASGKPTFSKMFELSSSDSGSNKVNGFLLFLPLYKPGLSLDTINERQQALEGFFYAPFLSSDVFSNVFNLEDSNFVFAIYDGEDNHAKKIYESSNKFEDKSYVRVKKTVMSLYDKKWTVVYKANSLIVPETLRKRPLNLIIGGSIFSAALASIIYLLIQRRTRSLAYSEQKRLEDAKDELLSLASHQLRTPATAVKQYISMLNDGFAGKMNKDQQELLRMAYESNERQLTIVDDLLYVARIDAGQTALRLEVIDVGKLLRSVVREQLSTIKDRKQKVELKIPKKAIKAEVDPQYLRMIIENLLSNASKYSHENKKIKLVLTSLQNNVRLDVIDQGVGIPPDNFRDIFVRFYRIPNELSRQIAGSGIGLYLSKQLALLHGGDITFSSVRNRGSTFSLVFPVKQSK